MAIDAIFTSADFGYCGVLKVMLRSLAMNGHAPAVLPIVVMTSVEDLPKFEADTWFAEQATPPRFVAVPEEIFDGMPLHGHISKMTYARLALADRRVCDVEKAMYLDADLLIRKSLRELFEWSPLPRFPVAAVRELGTPFLSSAGGVFNWSELGLSGQEPYFNAGVLLLDMPKVRQQGVFEAARVYLAQHGLRVASWDQGGLNAILAGRWQPLPQRFNWTTSANNRKIRVSAKSFAEEAIGVPKDAAIAHFTGGGFCKPWHINSISPYRAEYQNLAKEVGFTTRSSGPLEKKVGRHLAGIVRRVYAHQRRYDTQLG